MYARNVIADLAYILCTQFHMAEDSALQGIKCLNTRGGAELDNIKRYNRSNIMW